MLPKNVLYYGEEKPLPEQVSLQAGPLSVLYEEGDLRYINLGDQEILRRVYVAIRDRNWGTVLPVLSNVQIDADEDSFRIGYDVENKEGDIDFAWKGTITGDSQGTITFMRRNDLINRNGVLIRSVTARCRTRQVLIGVGMAMDSSDGRVR